LRDSLDPLDQEVHRERLNQIIFIILVPERQVDHDVVVFDLLGNQVFGGDLF
jgi:hypothetical protein